MYLFLNILFYIIVQLSMLQLQLFWRSFQHLLPWIKNFQLNCRIQKFIKSKINHKRLKLKTISFQKIWRSILIKTVQNFLFWFDFFAPQFFLVLSRDPVTPVLITTRTLFNSLHLHTVRAHYPKSKFTAFFCLLTIFKVSFIDYSRCLLKPPSRWNYRKLGSGSFLLYFFKANGVCEWVSNWHPPHSSPAVFSVTILVDPVDFYVVFIKIICLYFFLFSCITATLLKYRFKWLLLPSAISARPQETCSTTVMCSTCSSWTWRPTKTWKSRLVVHNTWHPVLSMPTLKPNTLLTNRNTVSNFR